MSTYIGLSQHIDFARLPTPGDRFELQDLIGEGTYGEVYSAKDKTTGKKVAIKILETIADNLEEIEEEYLVLRDLSIHPNLPSFVGIFLRKGACFEDDQLWFVMELCTGGSVTDLVQGLRSRGAQLSEKQISYILRETIQALIYLHENHCMHRDIKGHNILLTEQGHVKLVDFGVSSHLAATMARRNTSVGTPYWMSPEVIACEQQLDQSYDSRCDVWSIGITAIELAEGDPPLSDIHPMRALFQIPRNPPPNLSRPDAFSPELSNFIAECLVKDFEQRPFSKDLLKHPFLTLVTSQIERIRAELSVEIQRQRKNGRCFRQAEATTKHGKLKSDRKSKPQRMYMDDLASLEILTEEAIGEQLQKRYESNQIYTYIGDILVAVNPFIDLGLYNGQHQLRYAGKSRSENPPHIFAVADAAHQALVHQKQNQAIVISGESGSGKTESANLLLKQLVYLGKALNQSLENRILQVNPIMEAFGNARTGINSNSSRFGKYLDLTMTKSGKVTGARISVYLLEQSRVVQQAESEGNFHIFYYLYDGLDVEGRLGQFHLDPAYRVNHRYLSNATDSNSESNYEKWKQLKTSFRVLGFKEEEINTVIRVLAAILNLGDLEFGEVISNDNTDNKARVVDVAPLHRVARLLGVEAMELLEALTSNSVVTRGETITRNNTKTEAIAARDAMAKGLYGRLFDWMVNQINLLLVFNRPNNNEQLSVGLLDIFGFENFPRNSFEQICINIANEQIQYYFNQHIFTWEQQEYLTEGIPVDLVEFADNRPVLDMLLSRPLGLLALLDEESRFPRATDKSFIEKCHNNIKSKYYIRPKSDAICFAIHHFAGRVVYHADGFLEKNRNFLPSEVIQLVRQSQFDMIRFMFQCPITKTGNLYSALPDTAGSRQNLLKVDTKERYNSRGLASQSRAQQTVATYFRYSLMDLLQKMVAGSPQFVRCIKPNDTKASKTFESSKVIKQLRYTGVLETIRIRQHGFSHRYIFADFLQRYCFLAFGFDEKIQVTRENCRMLLCRLKMDGWALGKTKVFLKYYHVEFLGKLFEDQVRKITLVQACVRRWLAKLQYKRNKFEAARSAVTLQRHIRGWLTRRKVHALREQAKIQKALIEQARMKREQEERIRMEKLAAEKVKKAISKAKLPKKTTSHEEPKFEDKVNVWRNKENVNVEKAASIIQNHFRAYTIRKNRWSPELESMAKSIVNKSKSRTEAQRMLQKEGFKSDEIERIIARFMKAPRRRNSTSKDASNSPRKAPLTPRDQHVDMIGFSQKVHMLNQDVHKNLRRNKGGIRLDDIEKLSEHYRRPPGFTLIPNLVGVGKNSSKQQAQRKSSYFDHVQEEMMSQSSDSDVEFWDTPFYQKEQNMKEQQRRHSSTNEVSASRDDLIRSAAFSNNFLSPVWREALPKSNEKVKDVAQKRNHGKKKSK
ncbi:myosin-IIIb-like isoform X7 [Bradysia coprophila]|nr:myosin-IIIb-like isoform X7 [Bradysia coprophila]